ncbi:DUF4251 domain-containing protein [Confluentibacter citreus]|uniref:DUF4251 domain-containing protein n=1 Tax=Confluentibacter citreus TaxID=2007307 RepID=UPI000C28A176|nr:DUF4251 domain-containing protein [Confluentibacter citreus]
MLKILLLGTILIVFVACGSGNPKYSEENSRALRSMIENQSLEIISNRALPIMTSAMQQLGNAGLFINGSTAGSIDISTHSNYLRMKKDSVIASLPFYGERQFGGGYNTSSGIEFEGVPDDLQINKGKESSYEIRFNMADKNSNTDNYRVYIKLFPNLTSTISINSSSRSNIQYRGNVHAIDSDKQ